MREIRTLGDIPDSGDIYLYGAGEAGSCISGLLKKNGYRAVTAFIDSKNSGEKLGKQILAVDEYKKIHHPSHVIMICSTYSTEISAELDRRGIDNYFDAWSLYFLYREFDYQQMTAVAHEEAGTRDMDAEFLPIYEKSRNFSMTSAERMYSLFKAIEYLEKAKVPGAVVECGVWRGGSMMVAANSLLHFGSSNRPLYLFDTFEGLPKPDEELDQDLWGNSMVKVWEQYQRDGISHWGRAVIDEVRDNMASTNYPMSNIEFVKGMVEDTIPRTRPEAISLLRIDTDWYSSIRHVMNHLFPLIVKNGILILDDYGQLKGARQAVEEYFAENDIHILLHRTDYSGRIGIKTS